MGLTGVSLDPYDIRLEAMGDELVLATGNIHRQFWTSFAFHCVQKPGPLPRPSTYPGGAKQKLTLLCFISVFSGCMVTDLSLVVTREVTNSSAFIFSR